MPNFSTQLAFNSSDIDLPILEIIPDIQQHLISQNTLIVSAPPGAGKSTIVPLALLAEPWLQGKKILMLEPRRLAANDCPAYGRSVTRKWVKRLVIESVRKSNFRKNHHRSSYRRHSDTHAPR
jgi:ATP-dependent helicase HrpB